METIQFLLDILGGFLFPAQDLAYPLITCPIPLIAGIGMAISAAGTALGAAKGAKANRENQRILNDLNRENEQSYLTEYYRGALDNDGAKAYLKRLDSRMRERDKAAENSAVATGATQENILAQKQANNEVVSDAIAGLVENEESRKQAVRENYLNRRQSLKAGQMNQNAAVANNWANLGSGIASAAGSLASAYLMGDDKILKGSNPQTAA